jgi:hypothetical protein
MILDPEPSKEEMSGSGVRVIHVHPDNPEDGHFLRNLLGIGSAAICENEYQVWAGAKI